MKRLILSVLGIIVALTVAPTPLVGAQSVNNFTIRSFEADYYLDKDSEGRSTLKTVEKITAVFPVYNQNHGIERAIPTQYQDHSTTLKIQSIVDDKGNTLDYSTNHLNDNLVLRIGDADTYVHGTQTYVITYTQRDVTGFFADTNDDEFYWDVNGTQWAQPMERADARLHLASRIMPSFTDKATCYQGIQGSTKQCTVTKQRSGDTLVIAASADNLGSYENMTIAAGFLPHAFTPYQQTWQEKLFAFLAMIWLIMMIIGSLIAIIVIVWMSIRRHKVMNRVQGGTIIAEYLPPRATSVLLSAQVLKNSTSDMTAQLIDLAVRHYLKIYQTKDKTTFKPAEYELEIVKDISSLLPEEQRLLQSLFGKSTKVGDRFAMKKMQNNYTVSQKLLSARKTLRQSARSEYGIFEHADREARQFRIIGVVTLIFGIVTLSPLVVLTAIIAFIFAYTLWPLTQKGVALRDYLAGLKLYISVAEEDRIKMLQSPEGAEKTGVEIDASGDSKKLVKLYERVLPYAVLFTIEKEWAKQLGTYYEASGSQPDWYSGNTAFNAVLFSSALSSFSSQSSSYSSSASSSSGGAGGGGSSGGGGGGGGGGGW